jgi:branched-chain amino acid aminotransferase
VFRLPDHIRRLFRSASVYHMQIPFSQQEMVDAVTDTVRANELTAGTSAPSSIGGTARWGSTRCPRRST